MPEVYRGAVVLCDLQGLSHEQAARRLGCPEGTIKSRLSRGRARLRDRLRRLGVEPARGLGALLPAPVADGAVPRNLMDATTSAALRAAEGGLGAGAFPAPVIGLANGVLRMMRLESWKSWAIGSALMAGLAGGGWVMAQAVNPPDPTAKVPDRRGQAVVPPAEAPGVSYEVAFLTAPGLSARAGGISHDFGLEPPANLTFLTDLESDLFEKQVAALPGAVVVRAPKVTQPVRAPATIHYPRDQGRPALIYDPLWFNPDAAGKGQLAPKAAEVKAPGPKEGCDLSLLGEFVKDQALPDRRTLRLNLDLRDTHIVAIHGAEFPGPEAGGRGRRVEVPEVVRTTLNQNVTFPAAGGTVLFGLGLVRTVDEMGKSSVADRYVLVRARVSPEAESGPRPPGGASAPRP